MMMMTATSTPKHNWKTQGIVLVRTSRTEFLTILLSSLLLLLLLLRFGSLHLCHPEAHQQRFVPYSKQVWKEENRELQGSPMSSTTLPSTERPPSLSSSLSSWFSLSCLCLCLCSSCLCVCVRVYARLCGRLCDWWCQTHVTGRFCLFVR